MPLLPRNLSVDDIEADRSADENSGQRYEAPGREAVVEPCSPQSEHHDYDHELNAEMGEAPEITLRWRRVNVPPAAELPICQMTEGAAVLARFLEGDKARQFSGLRGPLPSKTTLGYPCA